MTIRSWSSIVFLTALAVAFAATEGGNARQREDRQPPPQANAPAGMDVLARGPVQ